MSQLATVDAEHRLQPPEDAREWFQPGARFLMEKHGGMLWLKPVGDLIEHLDRIKSLANDDEISIEDINAEVHAVRRARAGLPE